MSRSNKVNYSKYETLQCRSCKECLEILEKENPGFNLWNPGGRIYLITCSDREVRHCEVGDSKPSDCMLWELAMDKYWENKI
jgi:hypothetical protein